MADRRMDICKECPLFLSTPSGFKCNPKMKDKAVDSDENISEGKEYYGCGCYLEAKVRSPKSKCPLLKWKEE